MIDVCRSVIYRGVKIKYGTRTTLARGRRVGNLVPWPGSSKPDLANSGLVRILISILRLCLSFRFDFEKSETTQNISNTRKLDTFNPG